MLKYEIMKTKKKHKLILQRMIKILSNLYKIQKFAHLNSYNIMNKCKIYTPIKYWRNGSEWFLFDFITYYKIKCRSDMKANVILQYINYKNKIEIEHSVLEKS